MQSVLIFVFAFHFMKMLSTTGIFPPIMVRNAVCRDTRYVGILNVFGHAYVEDTISRLNESLAFLAAKYPFLGLGFFLYFLDSKEPSGSAEVINCNFKTDEENRLLRRVYPAARVSQFNVSPWIPLFREIIYENLHKALRINSNKDAWTLGLYLTGSVAIEFPGGSGVTIFVEGDLCQPEGAAFSHHFQVGSVRRPLTLLSPPGFDHQTVPSHYTRPAKDNNTPEAWPPKDGYVPDQTVIEIPDIQAELKSAQWPMDETPTFYV